VVYFFAAVAIVAGMIILSTLLGQRHKGRATGEPYESGMVATGPAHVRFDVKFYLVAMFFVIFDIEAVFIFAWSIAVREAGWAGYVEVLVFIAIMLCALVYLWRIGALEWSSRRMKRDT
jgi:NADH-quinone oxidoreductase subunit A